MIRIKRIYEQPSKEDGYRVLVDRLWPRGISKNQAKIDLWLKDVAPSNELRKWFGHDPKKWGDFKKRYGLELKKKTEQILEIRQIEKEKGTVTLVYSAKDEKHNQAVVLSTILQETGIDEPNT
jgi:uncharacterized protein YeaO (DUF488 family)